MIENFTSAVKLETRYRKHKHLPLININLIFLNMVFIINRKFSVDFFKNNIFILYLHINFRVINILISLVIGLA